MKLALSIQTFAITAMLAACGGADNNNSNASDAPLVRSDALKAAAAPAAAAAAQPVTVDEMLNWAESAFAQYFPSHAATQRYDTYSYRHYANGNYVGISDGGVVVGMGPYVGSLSQPVTLGPASGYACTAKPSACTTQVAYTVFNPSLTTQGAVAQVLSDGVRGSIAVSGYETASTADDYANVSWTGSFGGALRAGGNLLMFCTGAREQDTRVALSAGYVRVTDLSELAGRSFRENDCYRKDRPDQAGVFVFNADGSMQVPSGATVSSSLRDALFSDQGEVDASGTFRAQAYKIVLNGQVHYSLVFLNHDVEQGYDFVQFADPQ